MTGPALELPERGGRGRLRDLVEETASERPTRRVPHRDLAPDPGQPRTAIDEDALADLAQSIAEHGILQPVLVRPSGAEPPYYIVSGERRWRAAAVAGLDHLDVIVEDSDLAAADLRLRQLVENLQRDDLSLLDTARALRALIDAGVPAKELARRLGKSPAFVSQHLAALKAQGVTKTALAEGHLQSAETLRRFAALPRAAQQKLLARARATRAPIGRGQVTHPARSTRRASARSSSRSATRSATSTSSSTSAGDSSRSATPRSNAGNVRRSPHYVRRFYPDELRVLIHRLGGTLPASDDELGPAFDALVQALTRTDTG